MRFLKIKLKLLSFCLRMISVHCFVNYVLTANEGLVRIQYKCLDPIYVFPEMKLALLFPKQNYNVLSPNFHILVSVSHLYTVFPGPYLAAAK